MGNLKIDNVLALRLELDLIKEWLRLTGLSLSSRQHASGYETPMCRLFVDPPPEANTGGD